MAESYDVVIVGSRCAGSSLALLLARGGARVLVVDQVEPSHDTLSTHAMMRGAVILMEQWGLLEQVAARTPAVTKTLFHYGDRVETVDTAPLYAPRRPVLDPLLADAAAAAGAQMRFDVHVSDVVRNDAGRVTGVVTRAGSDGHEVLSARVVVGADGRNSTIARKVDAQPYHEGRNAAFMTYGYFLGVETQGFHWMYRDRLAIGLIPTSDGQVLVSAATHPDRRRGDLRGEPDHGLHHLLAEMDPELADHVAAATPVEHLRAYPGVAAFLRPAHGPGWALVGDAAHFKDPSTAHGITDAFRDAAFLAPALLRVLDGADEHTELQQFQERRDELAMPILEATERICSLSLPFEELQAAHVDLARAMRHEASVLRALAA